MKRIVASWNTYYMMFQDEVEKNWDKGPGEIENAIRRIYLKHKSDPDCQKAYSRWCEENDCDEEGMSQYDEPEILYVIKDSQGNQLSAPNKNDGELWDRVAWMESRGRRGLRVVVYTGK